MQLKFFTIPAVGEGNSIMEEELNAFLRGHRILNVQRELIPNGQMSCWCCCVEYIENSKNPEYSRSGGREKVDYRSVLKKEEFARFCILRECRKVLAEEEAIPAYAVLLDEHLAAIAKNETVDEAVIKAVNGIGEKKFAKYGKRLIELWESKVDEAGGESVLRNNGN